MTLLEYVEECRPSILEWLKEPERMRLLLTASMPTHPGAQKQAGGLALHVRQVIEKALALNQVCERQEIIECALVHDLPHCESVADLTPAQLMAIAATKGQALYEHWRHSGHDAFVVLILIADMWSAFINEKDWTEQQGETLTFRGVPFMYDPPTP